MSEKKNQGIKSWRICNGRQLCLCPGKDNTRCLVIVHKLMSPGQFLWHRFTAHVLQYSNRKWAIHIHIYIHINIYSYMCISIISKVKFVIACILSRSNLFYIFHQFYQNSKLRIYLLSCFCARRDSIYFIFIKIMVLVLNWASQVEYTEIFV